MWNIVYNNMIGGIAFSSVNNSKYTDLHYVLLYEILVIHIIKLNFKTILGRKYQYRCNKQISQCEVVFVWYLRTC